MIGLALMLFADFAVVIVLATALLVLIFGVVAGAAAVVGRLIGLPRTTREGK